MTPNMEARNQVGMYLPLVVTRTGRDQNDQNDIIDPVNVQKDEMIGLLFKDSDFDLKRRNDNH